MQDRDLFTISHPPHDTFLEKISNGKAGWGAELARLKTPFSANPEK
jgi:hypothetical protein